MEIPFVPCIKKFVYPFVFHWKLWKTLLPLQQEGDLKKFGEPHSIPQYPNILYFLSLYQVQDNIKILLHIQKPNEINISSTFTISVPSTNQSLTTRAKYGTEKVGYGEVFCTKNELIDQEKKYFVNEFLNIFVEGVMIIEIPIMPMSSKSLNGNYSNFLTKLWERDDKDFTIIVVGENDNGGSKSEIKVHKLVLATKSSVFDSMINTDMKEKAENKVEIIDFNAKTVQTAIEFLYDNGNLNDLTFTDAFNLIRFANKYFIYDLKDQIEFYLASKISALTICELTNDSVEFNATNLRKVCIDFLLLCLKNDISVKDFENLDKNVGNEVLQNAFLSSI